MSSSGQRFDRRSPRGSYSISDGLTVINDGVDEFEEVVGKRTVGWLVGVEEEVRDIHAETGLGG